MNKYIDTIRQNVCAVCVDSNSNGECTLTNEELCAVEMFLPKIIETIHSVDSHYKDDYLKALRTEVCSECKNQSDTDDCHLRNDANCSLDRYYSIIVDAVKKVDGKTVNQ